VKQIFYISVTSYSLRSTAVKTILQSASAF